MTTGGEQEQGHFQLNTEESSTIVLSPTYEEGSEGDMDSNMTPRTQ
jgi:hypothetical protein